MFTLLVMLASATAPNEHHLQFYLKRVIEPFGQEVTELDCNPGLPSGVQCLVRQKKNTRYFKSKSVASKNFNELFKAFFSNLPKEKILPAPPALSKQKSSHRLTWEIALDNRYSSGHVADFTGAAVKRDLAEMERALRIEYEIEKSLRY